MQALSCEVNIPAATAIKHDAAAKMNLRITWRFLFALFALTICTGELHEQLHIQTGRIICGGYGTRDFNVWQTTEQCAAPSLAFLAILAGPLWSYLVMWTGGVLLGKARSSNKRTIGFALVFAPMPFARIFTAVMGGGDEKNVLRAVLHNNLSAGAIKVSAIILVTLVCLPPILIAWRALKNRFAALYVMGFAVLPLVVLGLYVLTFLNSLLKSGLASTLFLGTPLFILLHFSLMALLFVCCRRWLLLAAGDSQ